MGFAIGFLPGMEIGLGSWQGPNKVGRVDDNGIVAWIAESPLKAAGNRIKGRVRKPPIHKADFSYN